jgi:hypothetical protein
MAIALAVLIVLAVLAAVAYPFIRRGKAPWMEAAEAEAMRELVEQKNALYTAIRQLDFDREMGNISQEDYRRLRSRYVRRAAVVLRDIEGWETEMERELEREVEALLRQRPAPQERGEKSAKSAGEPHEK